METKYHLAQYNIIKLLDKLHSPMITEFREFLTPVNEHAERSPGFIWRLKDEGGGSATDVETPYEDELIFINMSVWESIEDLEHYIYKTVHSYFLKNRKKWGANMKGYQSVMWWIPEGEVPTVEEAKLKLQNLNKLGPTSSAFSFNEKYDSTGKRI